MDSYQYGALPLRSIRLARALPQSSDLDIHISLEVADLDQEPAYDALSYTWGRPCTIFSSAQERDALPEPAVPITCDGRRLLVSKNLHDYLGVWSRMVQLSGEGTDERVQLAQQTGMHPPGALWIDAICINQNDVIEKNHQVAMMGQIYTQAQRVVVWLGPEDAFVRPALSLLFKLCTTDFARASELRQLGDDEKCIMLKVPSVTSSAWWACFAFLNRAWFTRSWIVQELALAPRLHVQCGVLSFSWEALTQACGVLHLANLDESLHSMALLEMEGPGLLEPHFYQDMMPIIRTENRPVSDRHLFGSRTGRDHNSSSFILTLEAIRQSSAIPRRSLEASANSPREDRVPMFELLDQARNTDCFDYKDKVYAFLGIAQRPFYRAISPAPAQRELVADYRLSVAQVFLESAWYILLSGQTLDLLSIAYRAAKREADTVPGLSSWVPDWTCRPDHMPMTGLHAFMDGGWCATRRCRWEPPEADKLYQSHLSVKGLLVDTIRTAAEDTAEFSLSRAAIVATGLPEEYPWSNPPQRRSEVFWRTLIADSTETEHPAPDFNDLCYNNIWLDEIRRASREQFKSLEKAEEWRRFVKGHRLFRSVQDLLKRKPDVEEVALQSSTDGAGKVEEPIPDTVAETQSIIRHLERTTTAASAFPMSQADMALNLMVRKAGYCETDAAAIAVGHYLLGISLVPTAEKRQDNFKRLMARFTRGRRVFRTDKNYLGCGLATLDVGDHVWLLSGAKVPVILRPLKNGRYILVGEAYVHGLMHGEGWPGEDGALREIELE